MQYFNATWVPKIEMWLTTIKSLPLASQESSGAIESYHVKLKLKLFDDSHLGALQRVDWLVHKLTTELHSSYWLDRYADESDSFQTIKDEYVNSTSWHRASKIPNTNITFIPKHHQNPKPNRYFPFPYRLESRVRIRVLRLRVVVTREHLQTRGQSQHDVRESKRVPKFVVVSRVSRDTCEDV
ncbi:unnamed protein product [Lactuca saligna]|uniref:Uncharacterized protein n=1 Tax=Lactuca saligna TaxID=75948 RepID=A0AA35Y4T3_LACSI|nr:unnamed protein product [Lactuca saligna]